MTLGEFKQYITSFSDDTIFDYSIEGVFSWRWCYYEVAFDISKKPSTKKEILQYIHRALTEEFPSYKSGEMTFDEYTPIHFEDDYSAYSSGGYVSRLIVEIEEKPEYVSLEERFVKQAFVKTH